VPDTSPGLGYSVLMGIYPSAFPQNFSKSHIQRDMIIEVWIRSFSGSNCTFLIMIYVLFKYYPTVIPYHSINLTDWSRLTVFLLLTGMGKHYEGMVCFVHFTKKFFVFLELSRFNQSPGYGLGSFIGQLVSVDLILGLKRAIR